MQANELQKVQADLYRLAGRHIQRAHDGQADEAARSGCKICEVIYQATERLLAMEMDQKRT